MGFASSKMRSQSVSIPEEYIDILVQESAYDPIRLPLTEDPAQVLYNRRTLETIWDTKHEALNPFTRQPFNISDVIPQAELRQQMGQYIVSSTSQSQVIPDYTKALSQRDMKNLLHQLISDYKNLINAEKCKKKKLQPEQYWNALWQRFNLLRLYCQYRPQNRALFSSIRGYKFLYQVITEQLLICLCHRYHSSFGDAMEVGKEVARLVDLIGFNESELATVPEKYLWALVHILSDLAAGCDHVKVRSMVLRIYCRLFYDCGIVCKKILCCCTVQIPLYMLGGRENVTDISNEDLYNGMLILKVVWLKNKNLCISEIKYVDIIVKVVIICIARFKDLHAASTPAREKANDRRDDYEEAKNIYMISVALDRGLWLIHSIVRVTSYEGEAQFFWDSKQKLHELDVVSVIVRLVQLALAGFKCIWSSHMQFAINIAAAIINGGDCRRRDNVVQIFGDFLRSDIVNEYAPLVKLLLQHFIGDVNTV